MDNANFSCLYYNWPRKTMPNLHSSDSDSISKRKHSHFLAKAETVVRLAHRPIVPESKQHQAVFSQICPALESEWKKKRSELSCCRILLVFLFKHSRSRCFWQSWPNLAARHSAFCTMLSLNPLSFPLKTSKHVYCRLEEGSSNQHFPVP